MPQMLALGHNKLRSYSQGINDTEADRTPWLFAQGSYLEHRSNIPYFQQGAKSRAPTQNQKQILMVAWCGWFKPNVKAA